MLWKWLLPRWKGKRLSKNRWNARPIWRRPRSFTRRPHPSSRHFRRSTQSSLFLRSHSILIGSIFTAGRPTFGHVTLDIVRMATFAWHYLRFQNTPFIWLLKVISGIAKSATSYSRINASAQVRSREHFRTMNGGFQFPPPAARAQCRLVQKPQNASAYPAIGLTHRFTHREI
jgi:hypothetical protein